ncbi:hypothetical protein VB834_04470 [Limnoraphis robusta Tam1]|nr:hypothetical protein [Limnoraphis robusta]MEA5538283.1 hypothetical protein [Limnoraphis robusta Tam1]
MTPLALLKSALVSVFSLLSSSLVAFSPFFQQVSLAESPLNSKLELFPVPSDLKGSFQEQNEQNTEDSTPDASRGESRRTSS